MPLNQVASVSTPDARTLLVAPWDQTQLQAVERAIIGSELGLNPQNDGKQLRINIPPLTEERRKDLVKQCSAMAEDAKIAIRNVRRTAKDDIQKMEKNKDLSEDQAHDAQEKLQKLTDQYVQKIDDRYEKKENEIMEI